MVSPSVPSLRFCVWQRLLLLLTCVGEVPLEGRSSSPSLCNLPDLLGERAGVTIYDREREHVHQPFHAAFITQRHSVTEYVLSQEMDDMRERDLRGPATTSFV